LSRIDANYIPLMGAQGLKWRGRGSGAAPNSLAYFMDKGVSCSRLRVWYGEEGPSRLPYALGSADAGYPLPQ